MIMDSDHVILTAIQTETIAGRAQSREDDIIAVEESENNDEDFDNEE